jgi:hypothetical protein
MKPEVDYCMHEEPFVNNPLPSLVVHLAASMFKHGLVRACQQYLVPQFGSSF